MVELVESRFSLFVMVNVLLVHSFMTGVYLDLPQVARLFSLGQ